MTDLLKRQRYVQHLRQGYTDTEAATKAGLSGRPSDDARRLAEVTGQEAGERFESLRRSLSALGELLEEKSGAHVYRLAKLDQALEVLDDLRREVELRREAVEVLKEES
ncbi:MAG: hypothetical protein ABEN55_13345 [Bradymonadaceae bacterium]